MKQLNEQQLQTHVPIVGWLLIARSVLEMVGGLIAFALVMGTGVLLTDLGPMVRDPEAVRVFPMVASLLALTPTLIGALVFGLAIPGLIAGIGLLARKSWARVLGVIVSVLGLVSFPFGTLIAIYALFVLLQDAAAGYFATPKQRLETAPRPV
jgi:lysylphosphatidylglycerol synthetase-like protein (DUF2156 family)